MAAQAESDAGASAVLISINTFRRHFDYQMRALETADWLNLLVRIIVRNRNERFKQP